MALVIDELPYLADVEPGLSTMLQHRWGAHKRQPNLKIFLAGSYLVATDTRHRVVLAGSCEWTNAKVDVREQAALQADLAQSGLRDGRPGTLAGAVLAGRLYPCLRQLAQAQQRVDLAPMYQA